MERLFMSMIVALLVSAAAPAGGEEDCDRLLREVRELVAEDSQILAQVRGKLERAAMLCEEGRTKEANIILQAILDSWMPMGMGN